MRTLSAVLAATVLAILGGLILVSLSPAADAHAAPDPLANSVHVLADEPEDAFYWYDGYDLFNLFVREAYIPQLDESGLVFRFAIYGGFAPAGNADEMAIDIGATSPEGAGSFTITTSDDEQWDGDLAILVANVTEDPLPWTGVTANMQVFASYDQLGTGPGGSLENIWMASRADADVRDRAPGGFYLPHSGGQAEVPAESIRLEDSLQLQGPHGYIDASMRPDGEGLAVSVHNTLYNGQHVRLQLDSPHGWNASVPGEAQASLPGGQTATFRIETTVDETARDPLRVDVVTDLGGRKTLFVGVDGEQLVTDVEEHAVGVEPGAPQPNESPGLTTFTVLAAIFASGAVLDHRHRRQP